MGRQTKGYGGAIICPATSELCGEFALSKGRVVVPEDDERGGWPAWATYVLFAVVGARTTLWCGAHFALFCPCGAGGP